MATMLAMTATVKAMDSQRWVCRTHSFQFTGTSSEDEPKADRAHVQVLRSRLRRERLAERDEGQRVAEAHEAVDVRFARGGRGPRRRRAWTTRPGGWSPSRPRVSIGSWDPREQVDELPAHHLPAVARAVEVLLLVRPEARLHEGQARARGGGREREGHDGVHVADDPRVAELPMRFDLEEPAIHDAVPPGLRPRLECERRPRLELELEDRQEPLREQYGVGERAPH